VSANPADRPPHGAHKARDDTNDEPIGVEEIKGCTLGMELRN